MSKAKVEVSIIYERKYRVSLDPVMLPILNVSLNIPRQAAYHSTSKKQIYCALYISTLARGYYEH
jgi:hypothetical protein